MQGVKPPAGLGRQGGLGTPAPNIPAEHMRVRRVANPKLDLVARVPDAESERGSDREGW